MAGLRLVRRPPFGRAPRLSPGARTKRRRAAAPLPAPPLPLAPGAARADERPFALTYEARTEAPGETELELYATFYAPHAGGRDARSWVHQLEIGRGLTERSDVAL